MVKGLYTGASSMLANTRNLDVIANNLANVSTIGFKRDEAIFKSFPEMLIRRTDDDGVYKIPLGSIDKRPVVGKIGTGVEFNESYSTMSQGSVRNTGNSLDFSLFGEGFFVVKGADGGNLYTRNGAFGIDNNNYLVTKDGHPVYGEKGLIRLQNNGFYVDDQGYIFMKKNVADDINRKTQMDQHVNEPYVRIDRLKVVEFPYPRYISHQGNSSYRETNESGVPFDSFKAKVKQGFLEMSNVNPVYEMVKMIEANRSYDASQKSIVSADESLDKLINNMGPVRA